MLGWGVGFGLIALLNIIAVPDASGMQATAEAISKMPTFVVQMVGGGDLAFLASPAGFLNNQYFAMILVFFGVYAIIMGLNITANEEDKRIIDVLLSAPVPRWRVVVEKMIAYGVLAAGVLAISTVGIFLSLRTVPKVQIAPWIVLDASLYILPGTLVMIAFTAFVGTVVRRRARAMAIAVVFLIVSWFIDIMGRTVTTSFINKLRVISFYAYYDTAGVMRHGVSAVDLVVPLVAATLLAAGAVWSFQRRNISV